MGSGTSSSKLKGPSRASYVLAWNTMDLSVAVMIVELLLAVRFDIPYWAGASLGQRSWEPLSEGGKCTKTNQSPTTKQGSTAPRRLLLPALLGRAKLFLMSSPPTSVFAPYMFSAQNSLGWLQCPKKSRMTSQLLMVKNLGPYISTSSSHRLGPCCKGSRATLRLQLNFWGTVA